MSCYESGRTRPRAKAAVLGADVLQLLAPGTPVTLVTLRARLGLTQDDVAAALGISRSLYAAVEQGKRAASVPETAALAAALHPSVDRAAAVAGVTAQPPPGPEEER
ncbi:helix-turn-helix transcriptional regulator [Sphaerisporangium viridialbum]|uniref:helix-turn-helix transcriptional regulator n=1 Tax=Sphaerisporangium viridialbum TaxID=46189 RepID=UPI003C784FA5